MVMTGFINGALLAFHVRVYIYPAMERAKAGGGFGAVTTKARGRRRR